MPRSEKERRVDKPPIRVGFKPMGIPRSGLREVILTLDEYEAVRLADGEALSHSDAAKQMGISRPTFSRLIEKARKKLADMLSEGLILRIEGGTVCFRKKLFLCLDCGQQFGENSVCPLCGSSRIIRMRKKTYKRRYRMNKKVALPITGGLFSTHFGHSEYFALYRIKDGAISEKSMNNTPPHTPGAFPAWLKEQGVDTVIVAGMGQKAIDLFQQAGITMIIGAQGSDPDAIVQSFISGDLSIDTEFNTRLHADQKNCDHS